MKRARQVKIKQAAVAGVEADLVSRLRVHGGAARMQLARDLNLAPSTVGIYVERLIADGLVCEGPRVAGEVGRPPTLLTLNPDGGRFVGVDIEARNAMITVVDFSQAPREQVRVSLRRAATVDAVLATIIEAVAALVAAMHRPLLGVGVGVPGIVDISRGVGVHYEHLAGWRDVPVARALSERLGVPVCLENNIRSMALAEMWFGAARGVEDFVCLGVRTGIGAGIVSRGRLQHGHDNIAGEIGSWPCPVASPGSRRSKGLFEPLESLASMSALADVLNGHPGAEGDWEGDRLREAWRGGDPAVRRRLRAAAEACGWVVGQLNLALNPGLIVVAGPLTALGDEFLSPLSGAVRRARPSWSSGMPRVEGSRLGPYAGALGAAALAVQQWKPAR
jgi:predicted NBD/HSP70 family sugar kinase